MGTCFYFIDLANEKYLFMPKMGEWPNDMYKLLEFLKGVTYGGGRLRILTDDDERLDEILKECSKWEPTDDLEELEYELEDLISSTHSLSWHIHCLKEIKSRESMKEVEV